MERNLISEWYEKHELELFYHLLKIGDLLEFYRIGFCHWAIYVGEQEIDGEIQEHCIIHRTSPDNGFLTTSMSLAVSKNNGQIELSTLVEVIGDDKVRFNNEMDREWPTYSPEEIIERAKLELNSSWNIPSAYSTINNNCEHFANYCRYGRKVSRQVEKVNTRAANVGNFALAVRLGLRVLRNSSSLARGALICAEVGSRLVQIVTRTENGIY